MDKEQRKQVKGKEENLLIFYPLPLLLFFFLYFLSVSICGFNYRPKRLMK
jgi:hypothetical protein